MADAPDHPAIEGIDTISDIKKDIVTTVTQVL